MKQRRPKYTRPQQRITDDREHLIELRGIDDVTSLWNARSGRPPVTRGVIVNALKSARSKIAAAILADPELCAALNIATAKTETVSDLTTPTDQETP